ncbi:MAG: LacI family DNA-binding transcriptional regulator [Acidobacteria bacterium]|nr:LacI family DNA-binding transcriptional regulator [Acidobacteriota bacterium]
MATIKEVASKAGVSIATVSNVISGRIPVSPHLKQRVLEAVRALDYHPNHIARSLKVRQTHMLGMIIPDITNPFFPEIIRGAEEAARERSYLLITVNTDERVEREQNALAALRSRRVDGFLIAIAPGDGTIEHIRNAADSGTPIVFLDRVPPGIGVDSVVVDNVRGARECVRHLVRMGHQEIAIITGSLSLGIGRQRLEGYQEALSEAGIEYNPALVFEGDFRETSGYRLGKQIAFRQHLPSAIFVCNAMMTVGVLQALDEAGVHCPRDIALATFDELPFGRAFHPLLTCVAQPTFDLGFKGASMLIDRIEGKLTGGPVTIQLPAELSIRESTAAAGLNRARFTA